MAIYKDKTSVQKAEEEIYYFDNSATTEPCQAAVDAVLYAAEHFGNPSSLHRIGMRAENLIKSARKTIAEILHTQEQCITFTAGGTEANNMAILGTAYRRKSIGKHLITTAIEHPSVLNAFQFLQSQGWEVTYLPVDVRGLIRIEDLKNALTPKTTLVSVAHVNNEIGTIQPIAEIGALIRKLSPKCYFHVDCVQSFLKIPIDLQGANVSLASFSAHKVHGFQGTGALFMAPGVNIDPIIYGGGQERGLRSGTENVAGISAFAAAAQWNHQLIQQGGEAAMKQMSALLHDTFENNEDFKVLCPQDVSAPHIISISRKKVRGEVLLHALEQKGFYVSTGTACSSHKRAMSHVLAAVGCTAQEAEGVIRISLSHTNTIDQVKKLCQAILETTEELAKYA